MDDERLIYLVQINDCIYNRCNPNYKSLAMKKKAWSSIAAELGVPETTVIKRYRILRDRFVKEKRAELLKGSESKFRSPLSEKLEFLAPHVFNKNAEGVKVAWAGKEPIPLNQSATLSNADPLHWNPSSSDQGDLDDSMNDIQLSTATTSTTKMESVKLSPTTALPNKRKAIDQPAAVSDSTEVDEAFCDALKSFKKLCQTREERKGNEALHYFGQMIVATIAGMSAAKQARAMMLVTEVVMQIKMEPEETKDTEN